MQAIFKAPKILNGSEFDNLTQVADGHGFTISEDNREHRHLILFRGDALADYQIHATGYSDPEHLSVQIIKHQKKYSRQPLGAEPDKVDRLPLFVGSVVPSDGAGIAAILQATVGTW